MEYLYNCRGCKKPDEEYPGHYETCDDCTGSGIDEEETNGECWMCGGRGDYIRRLHSIQDHQWARADAYGIYTGLYCDECYDNPNIYTYRKDEYFDEGYAGEQLYPDE